MSDTYNTRSDAQGTPVEPLDPSAFDYDGFAEHEAVCTRRCREFWGSGSGVLVNRRFRVPEVYSYGCPLNESDRILRNGAIEIAFVG